ncbi:MAG: asparagine synthase-related protein [Thaumarchaeota archaeon]|nr:asparagine synthase-related protein [Nitrososphaerota archaeon]
MYEEVPFSDLLPDAERESLRSITKGLNEVAFRSIDPLRGKHVVLAYSGGIDSSIAAKLISNSLGSVLLLTLGREKSADLQAVSNTEYSYLKNVSAIAGKIGNSEIETAIEHTLRLVSAKNLPHFEDCVSFCLIAKKAKEISGITTLVSANGPDELFCGYDRFRRIVNTLGYESARGEILSALNAANSLGKEVKKVVAEFGLELAEPFLSAKFIDFCLGIPIEYKIAQGNDMVRKRIWRYFGRQIRVPEKIVLRPKKAMQYGMGIHAVMCSMLKRGTLKLEFENKRK